MWAKIVFGIFCLWLIAMGAIMALALKFDNLNVVVGFAGIIAGFGFLVFGVGPWFRNPPA